MARTTHGGAPPTPRDSEQPRRPPPATAPIPNTTHALTIPPPVVLRRQSSPFTKQVKQIKALKQIGHHPLGALGILSIPRVAVQEKPFLREDADHCPDQQQHPGSKR